MKTQYLFLTGIILAGFIFSPAILAQSSQVHKKPLSDNLNARKDITTKQNKTNNNFDDQLSVQSAKALNIFNNIESAFAETNIEMLVSYLSSQTYLNLPNGTNGYYSSNQAYFVLEDFLKNYKISSFKFTEMNTSSLNPFASGVLKYNLKGSRDSTHIYVQLRKTSRNWNITQITIN